MNFGFFAWIEHHDDWLWPILSHWDSDFISLPALSLMTRRTYPQRCLFSGCSYPPLRMSRRFPFWQNNRGPAGSGKSKVFLFLPYASQHPRCFRRFSVLPAIFPLGLFKGSFDMDIHFCYDSKYIIFWSPLPWVSSPGFL